MKIIVFVKQVPNVDEVSFDPKTGNLKREGVESILNPPDAHAIEAALQLRERYGGFITVISMGPQQAGSVLKRALAMGCDESVLLSDRAFAGADTLATAYTLAEAAKKVGKFDIILCGSHAIDAETAQTGPAIAEFLDIHDVTCAVSAEVEDGWAICTRKLQKGKETVKVRLPALLTVCPEMNSPRYPKPIDIMRAGRKKQLVWDAVSLGCDLQRIGMTGSPSANRDLFAPTMEQRETRSLNGSAAEIAAALADDLEAEKLI